MATDAIRPQTEDRAYFAHVFAWMGVALTITGAVSAVIGHSQHALNALLNGSSWLFFALLIIELVLVMGLIGLVQHMDLFEAATIFIGYAALNGVTISVIFAIYTTKSIYATFFITAGMFAVLALVGYTTSVDLTRWGSYLMMALVGLLIGLVVNIFWLNSTLYWATTVVGVLLFSALTAYDVQRLKKYEPPAGSDDATVEKDAIVGALALYLDFVNLFLYLLRLFGRRR
jgi:FtsH-binding integral membrane protein